ncbi:hypothetical protein FHT40_002097 [Mycolicibacterium sp. BK556]|uniref:hypothetical protein n=1 Tax=unclassified Mycolicibacterium TaxID=2636767 RepID=UPI0016094706|nr:MULTISPECIES: hypothetical protein [unclassified Mycolicibacterium]MBB3602464.1 hypothetical protein [Mycolicibacterium sp. BK556]MBB3632216.1 hypothetical protein [Mycolicibacterium sp. BK607]
MAGTRYVGCLENVAVPPREQVAAALETITRSGPHTRLGLIPDARAWLWSWKAESAPTIRELPAEVAGRGTTAVLDYIRRLSVPRGPVDVYLSDRHIAFDIDHGLGDARLYVDCVTTLFDLIAGASSSWLRDRDTSIPVVHALTNTFADRHRLASAWTEARQRSAPGRRRPTAGAPTAEPPSAAAEVIHIDAATEREVDSWRASDGAGVSRAVTWLVIVRTALAQAGLPLTDALRLVVDCRRYLRPRERVNANFISGLSVQAGLGTPVRAIDAAVKARLDAALPLLALTSTAARNLAAPLSATRAQRAPADTPVELAYSDVGRLSPFENLPWLPDRPRSINAALQPWAPADISVFSGTIGRERSITLSYHDDVHDRRLLQEAAEAIRTDPIRLLR